MGYNNGRDNHEGKIGVSVGKSGRISKLLRRSWSRSLEGCAQLTPDLDFDLSCRLRRSIQSLDAHKHFRADVFMPMIV